MKPVKFKEVNVVYAENQPEYLPLPVYKSQTPEGQVTSCWELTWHERFKIFFSGRFFISQWSFHHPLQPIRPSTEFIKEENEQTR